MRIISRKKINDFFEKHADSKEKLDGWYGNTKKNDFNSFGDLKKIFPQVDKVDNLYVFNIGNNYRLIAAIHFNTKMVFIRHILTHKNYDKNKWRK